MTDDPERIDRLENRVDRLEERTAEELKSIGIKIDGLLNVINRHMLDQVKSACPSPGACITLAADLKTTIIQHGETVKKMISLEHRILAIEKWQGKILGGLAVLMVALALFGENLRILLRLE